MKQGGYATWTSPTKLVEKDTFTCCHCNSVVFLEPKKTQVGFCRLCMKPVCPSCDARGSCTPFEKQLEEVETRDRRRRAMERL